MVLPLVGIAVATAARLAAKKLAQEAVKKTAKSATSRARSNSAAAARAVAPKNPPITASRMKMAKTADARRKFNAATEKRILDNQVKKSVKVKPAAKPVGNPPNNIKAWEDYIGSVSRGAPGRGPAGKAKAYRVANSEIAKKTVPKANEPSRIPEIPARATVKINSAKTVRVIKVAPKKK